MMSWPFFYPLLLVLLCLFIAAKNYSPGTFLTGWDTLHPEFNFPLNFQRLIFGVWRSDQGLGAVSGHTAMSDLPRVFILWLFHFVFPLSFLRYAYIFLCLILGPLGFYFLINHLLKKPLISFLGSLVYLLNLGTLQQFFLPFEMFPTQWALLPWIIYSSYRSLPLFAFFTLLATPQAYAAHLWYPFFAIFVLFLLLSRSKKTIPLIILTLALNSFWLLPNIYYVFSHTDNPRYNLGNLLHSQEFLLKNRQTGTLSDTSLIKGFYFNWDQYNFDQKHSSPLMPAWLNHLENYDVRLIGNLLFLFALIGLILTFLTKNRQFIPLTPFFVIPFVLLANRTPGFDLIFSTLLKIPLLEEIFRFIFTKLSILLTFGLSLFFSFFLFFITSSFPKLFRPLFIILPISLLIYCYPYFTGQLISPLVRKNIPSNYFSLNSYLQKQPTNTILTLPLNENTGWIYTDWQYQGSGLIWFGTPQGFLDRDSDRWQAKNEQAYNEFRSALYQNNPNQFLNSLKKYRISHILWDQSIIPATPKNRDQTTFKYETEILLSKLTKQNYLSPPLQFGQLLLYPITSPSPLAEVKQISNFIGPSFRWHYTDFENSADYLTTNTNSDNQFPFRNILDNYHRLKPEFWFLASQPQNLFSQPQKFSALNTTTGTGINLPDLPHNSPYIIGIKSQYLSGIPLRLCFKNTLTNLCATENEISKTKDSHWDYFLIPPQDDFSGYVAELNVVSYGFQKSESVLEAVTLSPVDHQAFEYQLPQAPSVPITFKKIFPNNSLIKISLDSVPPDSTLILNQSFDRDWLAIGANNHLLVNNWANGWQVTRPGTIYLIFWPQLLQFIGFFLLILALILVL